MSVETGLVRQIDARRAQSGEPQPAAPEPSRLKRAVDICLRQKAPEPEAEARDRRIKEVADKLQAGAASDIALCDLRLALIGLRDHPAFRSSMVARQRLLSEAITRRGLTPVNALFTALFFTFEPGSPETRRMLDHLRQHAGDLRRETREFVARTRFFDSDCGVAYLLSQLDLANPVASLERAGLSATLQDSAYGFALKCRALDRALARAETNGYPLSQVLGWIELGARQRPDLQSVLYSHLLSPFLDRNPSAGLRLTITQFLLVHFGDPRAVTWPRLPGDRGGSRRDQCVAVMKRWVDRS
jgi:hypothetical protein